MSRAVRISVVMAVRHCTAYLQEALMSVLGQTFPDFEVLVLDDGSTDETPDMAEEMAARDDRIRVCRQDRHSMAETLNRGIAMARGELLARMDGDDVCLPERFERQLRHLQANRDVALVGTQTIRIDESGTPTGTTRLPLTAHHIRQQLMRRNAIAHPSAMMRREAVLAVKGYRTQFSAAQDIDLWLRLAERYDLNNLPGAWMKYRIHQVQTTSGRRMEQVLCALAARWSADCRRRGLPDPAARLPSVTRTTLLDAGFPEERLNRAELAVMGLSVREALAARNGDAVTAALSAMEQAVRARGPDPSSDAACAVARMRVALAERDYGRAVTALAGALWHPRALLAAALTPMEDAAAWPQSAHA